MARSSRRGFTLVELMIVIAIIGVLAALAVYGVSTYLSTARTSEAKNAVGAIARLSSLEYEREASQAELIAAAAGGSSLPATNYLCTSALAVPGAVPSGVKFQPGNALGSDFHTGNSAQGWTCLGFEMTTPIHYQYNYLQGGGYISPALGAPDPGASGFEAVAQGDLNGNGTLSTFARTGTIVGKDLRLATQIFISNEFE